MKVYLSNTEVTPRNLTDIGMFTRFTTNIDELSVNVDNIVLTRYDYETLVKPHIQQVGVFEGMPLDFVTSGGITLNYFLNLKENPKFRDYDVEFKVMKRKGTDHFLELANGTSFELLRSQGVNFPSFEVPYIIIKDNQAETGISLAIGLYLMVKEAIEATKQLITSLSDLIGAITPNVGAGVTMDIGDIITQVIKIIFQITYLALLIIAIIDLAKQLFELIFPKVRYMKANKVKDLIRIGCQNIGGGYGFSSTLLDSLPGLSILPVPLQKQTKKWFEFKQNDLNNSFNKGYPTSKDSTPTVGALISAIQEQFNARVRIINGVVHLERRDYWSTITTNTLMPSLSLQDTRQDEYTLNTNEGWKRYVVGYEADVSDLHTFDNFDGLDAEYSAEPVNVINADLVSITGKIEVNIPFALGARKESLNWIEKLAKNLFKSIDNLINTFGGNSSLVAKIQNRIGVLVISQQYFEKTKMLYTIGGKQPSNYLTKIRASAIYDQFHKINQIEFNGFKIRENVSIPISDQDFVNLIGNNYFELNGVIMEIEEFEYIEDDKKIIATYREPFNYALGKIETITIAA